MWHIIMVDPGYGRPRWHRNVAGHKAEVVDFYFDRRIRRSRSQQMHPAPSYPTECGNKRRAHHYLRHRFLHLMLLSRNLLEFV
jgi:hypothetical protein